MLSATSRPADDFVGAEIAGQDRPSCSALDSKPRRNLDVVLAVEVCVDDGATLLVAGLPVWSSSLPRHDVGLTSGIPKLTGLALTGLPRWFDGLRAGGTIREGTRGAAGRPGQQVTWGKASGSPVPLAGLGQAFPKLHAHCRNCFSH